MRGRLFYEYTRTITGDSSWVGRSIWASCEVLIHDLQRDIDTSLVYIENGTITNRHVGDGPSHAVLDVLSYDDGSEGRFGYLTKTKDGRILKSSTMYIRDDKGGCIAYLLGINQDITELVMMHRALDS